MITIEDFDKHNMKGLYFQLVITADSENDLADALQMALDDIGQGNKRHANATNEWFYKFSILGKSITEEANHE